MDLPRGQRRLLNRFRSDAGRCRNSMHEWGYIASSICNCSKHQQIRHIVNEWLASRRHFKITPGIGCGFQLTAEMKFEIVKANNNKMADVERKIKALAHWKLCTRCISYKDQRFCHRQLKICSRRLIVISSTPNLELFCIILPISLPHPHC